MRQVMEAWSDHIGEWQGVPVPLSHARLRLSPGHPLAGKIAAAEEIIRDRDLRPDAPRDDSGDVVVNTWFSRTRHARVYLVRNSGTGKYEAVVEPVSADLSMDRLTFALNTLGAAVAWTLRAEATAMEKLAGLLTDHQMCQYFLTGSFLETSRRSRVSYMFRRLRPTVAMTPRGQDPERDKMRCLAVLCLHPIGYYEGTWAGAMTPTDDVIAHLLLMRGDEPGFWRQANQHQPWTPEAGL